MKRYDGSGYLNYQARPATTVFIPGKGIFLRDKLGRASLESFDRPVHPIANRHKQKQLSYANRETAQPRMVRAPREMPPLHPTLAELRAAADKVTFHESHRPPLEERRQLLSRVVNGF